ncbi:MAG: hypothetical protein JXQ29_08760 [Planctomycetes bacterium]|nr:hypothetical protein [Planctomycetota bacterium]
MFGLFRRSRRLEVLRVLCYGKLPLAKDFLMSRGGAAARRFQSWVGALDRGGRVAALPRPQRALFALPGQRDCVVGTIWDSADAGGARKFPFALFFEMEREQLRDGDRVPVFAALDLWERLEHDYARLSGVATTEDFYRQLRNLRHDSVGARPGGQPAERFAAAARQYAPRDLARALFEADTLARWTRLLWRIERAVAPWRRSPGSAPTLAFRLPLAGSIPHAVQVEAWLAFIRARAGGAPVLPSIFFPAARSGEPSGPPGSFALIFRPVRESDVWLLQESIGDADVVDLGTADAEGEREGEDFAAAVQESLESAEADLRRFLPPADRRSDGRSCASCR